MTTSTGSAPAGWYADPDKPQSWRWWDGAQWTVRAEDAPPTSAGWYPDPMKHGGHRWWDGSAWGSVQLDPGDAPPAGSSQHLIERAWREVRDARRERRIRHLHISLKLGLASLAIVPISLVLCVLGAFVDAIAQINTPNGLNGEYEISSGANIFIGFLTFLVAVVMPIGVIVSAVMFVRFAAATALAAQESPIEAAERLNRLRDEREAEERERRRRADEQRQREERQREREAQDARRRAEDRERATDEERRSEQESERRRNEEQEADARRRTDERRRHEEEQARRQREEETSGGRRGARGERTVDEALRWLGLDRSASRKQIRAAHMGMVKQYHPDLFRPGPDQDAAAERMKIINDSIVVLKENGLY
jgi:hypothetical protein